MVGRERGWLKLYYSVLDDKKVMVLSAEDRWLWIELLCVAGEYSQDGLLPDLESISFRLYRTVSVPERLSSGVQNLIERNLIDKTAGGPTGYRLTIHDWDDWQPRSSTSAERMKRHRERHTERHSDVTSRARAKTDYKTDRQTDRARVPAREPASPDDRNISQKSEQQKFALRPMLEPPEEPEVEPWSLAPEYVGNGGADHRQSEFILERIIANYERSLEKGVNRAKVTELWHGLAPAQQIATAEGFLIWLLENSPKAGEPYDPKFVKNLDKLLEEGTLARRKFGPPDVDRHGRPVIDIRPKVLAAWLAGETYGQGQI